MDTSWMLHTQQHGDTCIHHGYYINSSNSSIDTHEYIMYTTYTAASAWIHMDTSWILHTYTAASAAWKHMNTLCILHTQQQ
jgi:hypothetical protein